MDSGEVANSFASASRSPSCPANSKELAQPTNPASRTLMCRFQIFTAPQFLNQHCPLAASSISRTSGRPCSNSITTRRFRSWNSTRPCQASTTQRNPAVHRDRKPRADRAHVDLPHGGRSKPHELVLRQRRALALGQLVSCDHARAEDRALHDQGRHHDQHVRHPDCGLFPVRSRSRIAKV
jgi:hypothetical protein